MMGFHAFGDFNMTRADFDRLKDHARSEFAMLVREQKSQTGDERDIHPDIATWLDLRHSYRIPANATDYRDDDPVEALAS